MPADEAEPAEEPAEETEEPEEAGSEVGGSGEQVVYRVQAMPWSTSVAGSVSTTASSLVRSTSLAGTVATTAVAVAKLASAAKSGPDLRRVKKLRGLLLTKYESVTNTAQELKWTALGPEHEEANDWHVTWIDTSVSFERIKKMGRLQKINHFPGATPARAPAHPHAQAARAMRPCPWRRWAVCAARLWQACSSSCARRARRAT